MTKVTSVSTQQITLAIRGMFCPKCALDIERALSQLDGVVAAQVNYASERATVTYDPVRVTALKMVNAIQTIAYDTPVEHLTLHSDDLLYATSTRTVERMLANLEGVVRVATDLAAGNIAVSMVPGHGRCEDLEWSFSGLRFRIAGPASPDARMLFFARTVMLGLADVLVIWSAGAHAGWILSPTSLHAPLVVVVLSLFALFGAGLPFFLFAIDAALQGAFDAGVVVALVASALAIVSLPVGMLSTSPWFTSTGLVVATTLTTGWFITRVLMVWVFPRFERMNDKTRRSAAAQAPLNILSDGSSRRSL